MKQITVYEVMHEGQVKLSTTSLEEAKEYAANIFDFSGLRCELQKYQHSPVDHTAKKS
jgi:hypothetical protein